MARDQSARPAPIHLDIEAVERLLRSMEIWNEIRTFKSFVIELFLLLLCELSKLEFCHVTT